MSIQIIAEAGVNHNGSLPLAKQLVDAAKAAGADYVKYQTFVPHNMTSRQAAKAAYQKAVTGANEGQADMLQKLALSFDDFRELNGYCGKTGIPFISTPFDWQSIKFLQTLDMPFWKIPSGEITNLPYLISIAQTHKPIVLSTGMSELSEVAAALEALNKNGAGDIALLHCNTEYPTPFVDVNLRAMETLRNEFGLPVGYSDHTPGIEVAIAAAALGACIIEKHFTLDRNMEGPDHRASLEPDELAVMVKAIRHIEAAMGDEEKTCSPSEMKNKNIARKSIVAAKCIKAGELFTEENITAKRPGNGISPMEWFNILGQTAIKDFCEDDLIQL